VGTSTGTGFSITGLLVSAPVGPPFTDHPPVKFGAQIATRKLGALTQDGDVNGDTLDDIAIGMRSGSDNARPASGTTYVIFGKADSAAVDLGGTSGASDRRRLTRST
jgi:hypothetical protein